ncbi:MAG: hypothetical protein ACLR8U_10505 [Oscillospiraceae bacterium]
MQPEYSKLSTYRILESFCRMLDIRVCYGKTPENSYAIADVDSYHLRIVMNESRIETGDHAARVLGHEIGHFLVEQFYADKDAEENGWAVSYLIEMQCDQIGNALYLLAERIAGNAEAEGEDLAGFINRAISETMERDKADGE